jgi:trans-aconitate methyltransferase
MDRPIDVRRFQVGDAADFEPTRRYDLVFSEDVFEHIPRESLSVLVPKMARWLRPGGLALIRPNVYTGITGGHALDWSRQSFIQPSRRTVEPWDHLRGGHHRPNTYLNQLTRQEYRDIFSTAFTILDEEVALPGLGREFLTGSVARELDGWSDDELFSNQVRMVLRPRT